MGAFEDTGQSREELLEVIKGVREQLEVQTRKANNYAEELRQQKEQNLAVQKQIEIEEECITNKLMKRLEALKREKQVLATEVETEEEFLVNNLQKRLQKLTQEKVALESQLEAENEYVTNQLQRKVEELRQQQLRLNHEKVALENSLEAEQEYITNKLQKQVDQLAGEKRGLQHEKVDLQRQVTDLAAAAEKLRREKIMLETQMEAEEEALVNRLQRQIESLVSSYKALEAKAEARGLNVKELAPLQIDSATEWLYGRSPTRQMAETLQRPLSGSSSPLQSSGIQQRFPRVFKPDGVAQLVTPVQQI
eukprot:jgi/Botrbrau1/6373/Bobra.0098s0032.1